MSRYPSSPYETGIGHEPSGGQTAPDRKPAARFLGMSTMDPNAAATALVSVHDDRSHRAVRWPLARRRISPVRLALNFATRRLLACGRSPGAAVTSIWRPRSAGEAKSSRGSPRRQFRPRGSRERTAIKASPLPLSQSHSGASAVFVVAISWPACGVVRLGRHRSRRCFHDAMGLSQRSP